MPGPEALSPAPSGALCRYIVDGAVRIGIVASDGIVATGLTSVLDGIVDGSLDDRVLRAALDTPPARVDPERMGFLPPTEPRTMLYCGRNYEDHLAENPRSAQPTPIFFSKLVTSLVGHQEPIRIQADQHVDYEGELAVIIGRVAHRVPAERAMDHVAGYTIANDVTDRAVQHVNHQTTMGKGPDTFGPIGPYLVPRNVVGDGDGLRLRTWVNGEVRQDGNTSRMIHDVATCIAAITRTVTLHPGDVVATGTPAGTGAYMDPPMYLQAGDTVTVAIDGLGVLSNPVTA